MKRHLICAGLLALALGCTKKPMPSPQYAEASGVFSTLIDTKGDDAWSDPEMDRVYALCNAVSPKSTDYDAARQLMAKIDAGRKAAKGGSAGAEGQPGALPDLLPRPPPTAEADGGPEAEAPPPGLEPGADFAPVQAKYGVCFTPRGTVTVTGEGAGSADGYEWAGRSDCPKAYASLADKLLLVRGGKVLMLAPKASLKVESYNQLPDGGRTLLDGGPVPPPPAPEAADAGAAK